MQILDEAKRMLLQCATPESIVRLTNSVIPAASRNDIERIYFTEQCHENIFEFAHHVFMNRVSTDSLHLQVCCFLFCGFCHIFLLCIEI